VTCHYHSIRVGSAGDKDTPRTFPRSYLRPESLSETVARRHESSCVCWEFLRVCYWREDGGWRSRFGKLFAWWQKSFPAEKHSTLRRSFLSQPAATLPHSPLQSRNDPMSCIEWRSTAYSRRFSEGDFLSLSRLASWCWCKVTG
jgi:hypothetical protein